MSRESASDPASQCLNCGFEAASGGDDWNSVDVGIGTLAQCPECDSTNILTGL